MTRAAELRSVSCSPGSRGDAVQLSTYFAPLFRWYTVADGDPSKGGSHFGTSRRDELLAYFAARHAQHERLWLRVLQVTGPSSMDTSGGGNVVTGVSFAYILGRAAGAPRTGTYAAVTGKGAVVCANQTILVWSMGIVPTASEQGAVDRESVIRCPPPPAGTRPGIIVACGG